MFKHDAKPEEMLQTIMEVMELTTQQELADFLNVSKPSVSRWLQGSSPNKDAMKLIGDMYHIVTGRWMPTHEEIESMPKNIQKMTLALWKSSSVGKYDIPKQETPHQKLQQTFNELLIESGKQILKNFEDKPSPFVPRTNPCEIDYQPLFNLLKVLGIKLDTIPLAAYNMDENDQPKHKPAIHELGAPQKHLTHP